jgi:hypothetical protein
VATLTQIINAGYRRSGRALLCLPPDWEPSYLPVFGPKVIAGIGKLPDTVASRSVPIGLKRKRRDEKVERFRRREAEALAKPLRLAAAALAAEHVDELRGAEPELPDELGDRLQDVWEPLLAIADLAAGDWPKRARAAAAVLAGARDIDDTSSGVQLLAHIRDLFVDERISCSTLVSALNANVHLPYSTWNDGKGITTRELGKKLKPYGVKAKTIRLGNKLPKGYERDQFEDVWTRYLHPPDDSESNTYTTQSQTQKAPKTKSNTNPGVAVSEKAAIPHGQRVVPLVALSVGDPGYAMQCEWAFAAGHLTDTELLELTALDRLVRRDRDRPEEPPMYVDAEAEGIAAMIDEGEETG